MLVFIIVSVLMTFSVNSGMKYENVTFDENAEITYAFPTDLSRELNRSVEFQFKTKQDNSFLLYIGSISGLSVQHKVINTQFISVYIEEGLFQMVISNPHAGEPTFYSRKLQCNSVYNTCADDKWHSVEIRQLNNEAVIILDENKIEFKSLVPETFFKTIHLKISNITEPFQLYRQQYQPQFPRLNQFRGCMKKIYLIQNNVKLNIVEMVSKNVYNFHSNGKVHLEKCLDLFPPRPVTFSGKTDFIKTVGIKSNTLGGLLFAFKTFKVNCFIAYQSLLKGSSQVDTNFYSFEIKNSNLYLSIGHNSDIFSDYLSQTNVSNGLTHTVEMHLQIVNVIVILDNIKFVINVSRSLTPIDVSGPLYIGAVDESKILSMPHNVWFGLLAQFFSGCIINMSIDDRPIHLDLLIGNNSTIKVGCTAVEKISALNLCANQPCNEGICHIEWDQRSCDCSRTNFTGDTCNKEAIVAEFNGYQFMRIKFPYSYKSEVENLKLRFKSKLPNGLILSSQNQFSGATDKLQIFMKNGNVYILLNFGKGNKKFKTNENCYDGKWHTLQMERRRKHLKVWIDENYYDFNNFLEMELPIMRIKYLIIGSLFDNGSDFQSFSNILANDVLYLGKVDNIKNQFFLGHMMHFMYNGRDYFQLAKKFSPINIEVTASLQHTKSIKQFAINFNSVKSYLVIPKINIFGDFRLEFQMKTLRASGLLLYLHGESNDYLILEMVSGLLHIIYNWGSGYKRKISESGLLNDGMWHSVKIVRHMSKTHSFAFRVDGIPDDSRANIPVNDGGINFNDFGRMHLGGYVENKSIVTFDNGTPKSQGGFQGCIASFYVNNSYSMDTVVAYKDLLQEASEVKHVDENCPDSRHDRKNYCDFESCSFSGKCIQHWSKYSCDCSLTSFTGPKCETVSTTVQFIKHPSYVVFKYSITKELTINQLAFGFQTNTLKTTSLISIVGLSQSSPIIEIKIKIDNDYGFIEVDYNTNSGMYSFIETRLNVVDGFYHIVRFTREGVAASLKIDNLSERIHVPDGLQQVMHIKEDVLVIVGSNAIISKKTFQGYMSGLSINQILFMDLLKNHFEPNTQLINKSNIAWIQNFTPLRNDRSSISLKQSEEESKSTENNQKTNRLVVAKPHCPGITDDEKIQCQQSNPKGIVKPGVTYRKVENNNDKYHGKTSSQETQQLTTSNLLDWQLSNNQATPENNNYYKINSPNKINTKNNININIWLITAFSCGGAFILIALSCLIYRCSTKDEGSYNVKEDRICIQTNVNFSKLKVKVNGDEKSNQSLLSNVPSKRKSKRKRSGETKEWYV